MVAVGADAKRIAAEELWIKRLFSTQLHGSFSLSEGVLAGRGRPKVLEWLAPMFTHWVSRWLHAFSIKQNAAAFGHTLATVPSLTCHV